MKGSIANRVGAGLRGLKFWESGGSSVAVAEPQMKVAPTPVCTFCDARAPESLERCTACGVLLNPIPRETKPAHPHYPDFGFCPQCDAVNALSESRCRKCGSPSPFTPLSENPPRKDIPHIWRILQIGAIVACFTGVGAFVGVPVLLRISYLMSRAAKMHKEYEERKARLVRDADQLLCQMAAEQEKKAVDAYREAKRAIERAEFDRSLVHLDESRVLGLPPELLVDAYALAHFRLRQYAQAIPFLEQRVDRKPALDLFNVMLGEAYLANGFKNEEQVERFLRIYAKFDTPLRRRGVLALAQKFQDNCRTDDAAEAIFAEALKIEPDSGARLAALTKAQNASRKTTDVIANCGAFRGEHSRDSLKEYATALYSAGNLDADAVAIYAKYLRWEPRDTEIRLRLCQGLVRSKELREAVRVYREGLTLTPEHISLRYHLALTLQMAGDIDGAIAECQQLLKMPEVETYKAKSDIYLHLGRCFAMKRMFAVAYKQFMLAGDGRATLEHLYKLGDVALASGDKEIAKQCWASILMADINFKDVKTRLAGVN